MIMAQAMLIKSSDLDTFSNQTHFLFSFSLSVQVLNKQHIEFIGNNTNVERQL